MMLCCKYTSSGSEWGEATLCDLPPTYLGKRDELTVYSLEYFCWYLFELVDCLKMNLSLNNYLHSIYLIFRKTLKE